MGKGNLLYHTASRKLVSVRSASKNIPQIAGGYWRKEMLGQFTVSLPGFDTYFHKETIAELMILVVFKKTLHVLKNETAEQLVITQSYCLCGRSFHKTHKALRYLSLGYLGTRRQTSPRQADSCITTQR